MTMPQLVKLKTQLCLKKPLKYWLLNKKILQVKIKKIQLPLQLEMQLMKKLKNLRIVSKLQQVSKKRLKKPSSNTRRSSCLQLSTPSSITRILSSWRASFKINTMEKIEVQQLTKLRLKINSMTTVKEKEDGVRVRKVDADNASRVELGQPIWNSVTTLTSSSCRMTLVENISEK